MKFLIFPAVLDQDFEHAIEKRDVAALAKPGTNNP